MQKQVWIKTYGSAPGNSYYPWFVKTLIDSLLMYSCGLLHPYIFTYVYPNNLFAFPAAGLVEYFWPHTRSFLVLSICRV